MAEGLIQMVVMRVAASAAATAIAGQMRRDSRGAVDCGTADLIVVLAAVGGGNIRRRYGRRLCCSWPLDGSNEPVTSARQRLNETRRVRSIAKRRAKLADGVIDALVEVDKGVARPQGALDLFARNKVAGALEQQG